jgi:glycosyltransferase involved in cell wall biosynthesis
MQKPAPLISILIPVYNGHKFLEQTLDSLLNQSFRDFELICINDASSDNSLDIINKYSDKLNLRIINLEKNVGRVPFIIKTFGLPNVQAKYYMYMSQDDILSSDCLENMYSTAVRTDADAVLPDFVYYDGIKELKRISGVHGNRELIISGYEAFIFSLDWEIPGAVLWRSEMAKKLGYEDFNMYADEYTVRKYYLECKKVAFCEGTFYYRTNNPDAITKKMKPALFSKVFKELKLLELVHQRFDKKIFKARMDKLIVMFYDYHHILFEQKFDKVEKAETRNTLKNSFIHFNRFIDGINTPFKTGDKVLLIKYLILRSGYFPFYWFCRLKYNYTLLSKRK